MKKIISLALSVLIIISSLCISTTAFADDTTTVNVTVKYCQTNARTILDMVNDFRTGDNAWCWNSDNSAKVDYSGLSALTYDYNLEKTAMLRAAEIAISYSHTRPNGTSCFTAYDSGSYRGENIAAGYTSASAVFNGWLEENDDYSGQGHRRNMLNSNYSAIGIGCVYYNGYYYWVQEFRNSVVSNTATTANDSNTPVDIDILSSNITSITATPSVSDISLSYGSFVEQPKITASIVTTNTWPSGRKCPVNVAYTWKSSNTSVAQISNGNVVATGAGSATINATVLGKDVSVPVTVTKAPVAEVSKVTLSATSYTYDGKVKKPTVTVKDTDGNTLKNNTDYTVSYSSGRKNVGKYTVTVKFKGDYSGTVKKTFTIKPKGTSIRTLTAKSKGFKATWKKQATQTTGYQIQYSTNSKFSNAKTVIVSKNSTTSKTISKLAGKKKYYVRVRTYKTVNGTKYYSSWSSAKTVTTKK